MSPIAKLAGCVGCSCSADFMVYAVLMVFLLLVIAAVAKLHILPDSTRLMDFPAYSPMIQRNMDCVTHGQTQKFLWFRSLMERKNSRIRQLAEQKFCLAREITELQRKTQASKQEAAREFDRKDKEMKTLARKCRKILDPDHPYDDDMDIGIVAILAEQRHSKLHESLKKREMALANGDLAKALKLERKTIRNQADAHRLEIEKKESQISQLGEHVTQLSEQNGDRELQIKTLNGQLSRLNDAKTKLEQSFERSVTQANTALEREREQRVAVEKTVMQRDRELEDARGKAVTILTAHRETQVALTVASEDLAAANYHNEMLEGDLRDSEHRVANLRERLAEVRRSNRFLEKEADKLRPPIQQRWDDARVAARIKSQFELEFGTSERKNLSSETTEATSSVTPCEHKADLRAFAAKEKELTGHMERLESANKVLQTQSAADKDAHQAILVQATALRDQIATELGFQTPKNIGLDQCFDECRSRLIVANQTVQDRDIELHNFLEKHDASQTELHDLREKEKADKFQLEKLLGDAESGKMLMNAVKEGRDHCVKEIKVKEDEILRLQEKVRNANLGEAKQIRIAKQANDKISDVQKRLTEAEKNVKEQRSEYEILEKALETRDKEFQEAEKQWGELECKLHVELGDKVDEIHLSNYFFGQGYGLPEIEAVERDVARARAIAEELEAVEYDDTALSVFEELANCNDCVDTLRATLQQKKLPSQETLRDILDVSCVEEKQLRELKQDLLQLKQQIRQVNALILALCTMLDEEAEETARASRLSAHLGEGKVENKVDNAFCRSMLDRLDAPRDDGNLLDEPLEADDADMAEMHETS